MLLERDLGLLADIQKYATRALSHVNDMTFEQFNASATAIDAVIHCLTVIGEPLDACRLMPVHSFRSSTGAQ